MGTEEIFDGLQECDDRCVGVWVCVSARGMYV